MITELKSKGFGIYGAHKPRGSIVFGNALLNKFNIHIIRDNDFRKEQENYKYKEVNGIKLNEPIDKWNHLWDASRYAALSELRFLA
jgi:phage terminase large subunit